MKTPRELGFSFPAEWSPQRGTWMSWPRPEGISFPDRYHKIGAQLCEIARQIAKRQELHVNVPNGNWERIVRKQMKAHDVPTKHVTFHHVRTNESWCRDHGPAFVTRKNGEVAIVDWDFNAWGGKYPPYDDDNAVPRRVAEALKIKRVASPGIVMEGGAVDFNGAGTVLTTTDCLLNKNRNPHLSKADVERYLKDFYGQRHVCWLTGGIDGDDTDGHVDDLARFVSASKIVVGIEADEADANFAALRDVRGQLDELRDQDGKAFEIVELPMPRPVVIDGQRCPATYVNFLFVNGALLVPTFGDKRNDARALSILREHVDRDVVGIRCDELIWGLGSIHCLTQQVPAPAAT